MERCVDEQLARHVHLSERQWAQIAPLIAEADPAALAAGRELVAALLEQTLTGARWASLVAADPRWAAVQAVCRRWQALGLLDELSAVLRVQLGPC
jgi:transposase